MKYNADSFVLLFILKCVRKKLVFGSKNIFNMQLKDAKYMDNIVKLSVFFFLQKRDRKNKSGIAIP